MRRFRRRLHAYLTVGYLVFGAGGVAAAALGPNAGGPAAVGPHPDGTATATYGWHVTPAGAQTGLGEKPFGAALSPDGKHLAISNDGTHTQSLSMLDVATGRGHPEHRLRGAGGVVRGIGLEPGRIHALCGSGRQRQDQGLLASRRPAREG